MKAKRNDLSDLFPNPDAAQKYKFYRGQILRDLKLLNDNHVILSNLTRYMGNYYLSSRLFEKAQFFLERCYLNTYQNSIIIAHRIWNEKKRGSMSFVKYVKHIKVNLLSSPEYKEDLLSEIDMFSEEARVGNLKKILDDIAKLRHKLLAHGERDLLVENNDKALMALITRQFVIRHPPIDDLKMVIDFLNEFFHALDFTTDRPISMNCSGFHEGGKFNSCIEALGQLALDSDIITEYDHKNPEIWEKKFCKRLELEAEHIELINEIRNRNGLPPMDIAL